MSARPQGSCSENGRIHATISETCIALRLSRRFLSRDNLAVIALPQYPGRFTRGGELDYRSK